MESVQDTMLRPLLILFARDAIVLGCQCVRVMSYTVHWTNADSVREERTRKTSKLPCTVVT